MSDLSPSFSHRSRTLPRPIAARRRSVFGMLGDLIALRRQRLELLQLDARALVSVQLHGVEPAELEEACLVTYCYAFMLKYKFNKRPKDIHAPSRPNYVDLWTRNSEY